MEAFQRPAVGELCLHDEKFFRHQSLQEGWAKLGVLFVTQNTKLQANRFKVRTGL